MSHHATVGKHYSHLLEKQLNEAIQKKLDETSSFKKKMAGIHSAHDAKHKGYAPSDAQIDEMKACIERHADTKYAHAHFRELASHHAVKALVEAVSADIKALNDRWKRERKFSFDASALHDLAGEAATLIAGEHDAIKKNYPG